ncbi:Delta(12)-fatty-acid desaturase [Clydaea vesicula]|uniref:Delta(12)-fatty-acid desaturase n=1 Tax=Clydaea vesicula TaxID=447962 RepID=A0AAD5TV78_9FUNG|nr:Delta(12)-fatty-acid desaturase [Clydaea vesicula]KAJ3378649.1 Delta(12)-fatty-acid desaturase [Lobulomyces angularis]
MPDKVQPNQKQPFTFKQLQNSIPKHCFQRNLLTSFSYVFVDLLLASLLFYFATFIQHSKLQIFYLPLYWISQGVVCTGIWVLAHECGHQAFSDYGWVNDTVGFILHSALLVPYFAWKRTHANHHKKCAHMDYDQVFVPKTRSQMNLPDGEDLALSVPIVSLLESIKMLLLGWPAYLLFNISSQQYDQWVSHFIPSAPIFEKSDYNDIVKSNIGVLFTISILVYLSNIFSFLDVAKYYIVPYLVVNGFLVLITFLQHTHPDIPHYRGEEWSFLAGALATVDRDYGILNYFFHHIGNTHVAHHLFSKMPHYHAQEATEAIKKVLGSYYKFDNKGIFQALIDTMNECRYVEDTGDIVYYVNLKEKKAK